MHSTTEPTVSAIVCAYTLERWELLNRAIDSLLAQKYRPIEIILCIDHNEELFQMAAKRFSDRDADVRVVVVENRYPGRLGSARNTAAEIAAGEILAFLDDDARADPSWLAEIVAVFGRRDVVAVGGAPLPDFAVPRPRWFPGEFDWVFGCSYEGLPKTLAPTRRLIGAAMSVRRSALAEINGFHSDNHDDMDMCHRLADRWPHLKVMYQPAAVVHHHVPKERLTWRYFWKRCYTVNKGKVAAFRGMGSAASMAAERRFVAQTLSGGLARELRAVRAGELSGALRSATMLAGVAAAGSGYLVGTFHQYRAGR
ncbi:glycosyl transferase [Frankia sp. CcI156]|uniref:Glycosyl transferase, family 2 n=1 Tax=Frankia casuarinae (strain DSM 45818 / CECT 9043 / HFP020203 / CcI3) TaxID=106370 RepID=Q2J696_FRACC|nr:glycosyl transferase, family 2 [Frankia casuarinae]OHV51052.1 glycosyl transferase [Frankia sp. CgIS1]ONH23099.1 glycosyl transferase [Frankia sp. CcI156]TFE25735.1 glycosyltransferase family 2 protein [Frankia sp. B2]